MLTQSDFINIEKQATAIYESLELQIIEEIATRVANVGYVNTVVLNDIQIAQEMGVLYIDIISLVAKYNHSTYEEVAKIFEEAGTKTLKFDDKIYTEAGLNPLPINQSPGMVQMLNATIEKTSGNLQNLVMTTAISSQTQFYNAMLADFSKDGSWQVSWGVQPTWPILPMIVLQPNVRSIARRPHPVLLRFLRRGHVKCKVTVSLS